MKSSLHTSRFKKKLQLADAVEMIIERVYAVAANTDSLTIDPVFLATETSNKGRRVSGNSVPY